ncbi:tryptophan transporter [Sporolactobacillus shoreae]|uniref:Tryptophan transporter n=1 Tax=Sporolactobacillus shoreae TaxID=1465501 RepID=A0A4Z0GSG2_9BACL|nr:tryptophan transporter [Sporolactobacillus shoreae]TGA99179.1 tryptophan transporter [Sporolactobacillus shoreae]
MRIKNLVIIAVFLAIGAVLHAVVPPILFGMKPDLMLVMLFLALYFFADKKSFLAVGLVAGIIGALTTAMPGGQLPSIIDKFSTTVVVFLLFSLIAGRLQGLPRYISAIILGFLGTSFSGAVFLASLVFIMHAQVPLAGLFLTLVLPTAAFNTVCVAVLYPIVEQIGARSGFIKAAPKASVH